MTILSAQSIELRMKRTPEWDRFHNWRLDIEPWEPFSKKFAGLSYGLTAAGYDIRIGSFGKMKWTHYELKPGEFLLASSLERVKIPTDLQVIVHDKSTLARQGLALQNTVLEPGWEGHITLELSNHGPNIISLLQGQPIAQLIFHQLDAPTERPYIGKYQNQGSEPVQAIFEEVEDAGNRPSNASEQEDATSPQEAEEKATLPAYDSRYGIRGEDSASR